MATPSQGGLQVKPAPARICDTPPVIIDGLTYRLLPPEEWQRLKPIFEENDWFLPPAELATCAIAENAADQIVHLQIIQLVLHAEPRWTHPLYQGKIRHRQTVEMLRDIPTRSPLLSPGFVAIAPDEHMEAFLKRAGFVQREGSVWVLEFKHSSEVPHA